MTALPEPAHRPLASGDLANPWQLDEFFEALGPVMGLSPKEKEPAPRPKARSGRRPQFLVLLAMILMLAAGAWGAIQWLTNRSEELPAVFAGTWRTEAKSYADRMFEIEGNTLRLRLGADSVESHPIAGVHGKKIDGVTWYTITYGAGTDLSEIVLGMDLDSTVHIAHQPAVVWRKVAR